MTTEEMLKAVLDKLTAPNIPVQVDLWDTAAVAAYLKRSYGTVRDTILPLPSFPKPIRLPGRAKSYPLYKAREVIAWAESHQSKA